MTIQYPEGCRSTTTRQQEASQLEPCLSMEYLRDMRLRRWKYIRGLWLQGTRIGGGESFRTEVGRSEVGG